MIVSSYHVSGFYQVPRSRGRGLLRGVRNITKSALSTIAALLVGGPTFSPPLSLGILLALLLAVVGRKVGRQINAVMKDAADFNASVVADSIKQEMPWFACRVLAAKRQFFLDISLGQNQHFVIGFNRLGRMMIGRVYPICSNEKSRRGTVIRCCLLLTVIVSLSLHGSVRAADEDDEKKVLGLWMTDCEGMKEGWKITKNKKGEWEVLGQYIDYKTANILGAFKGKDYEFKDGKLHFTQVWIRKPKANWTDGNKMTLECQDSGKLKFSWETPTGSKGSRDVEPLKDPKKKK
jgi:hypothetical protein